MTLSQVLTLQDGTEVSLTDASTATNMIMVLSSKDDVLTNWEYFTEDNLKSFTIDDTTYTLYIPVSMNSEVDSTSGNYTVTFVNRAKTTAELQAEQIAALEEAVTALAEA